MKYLFSLALIVGAMLGSNAYAQDPDQFERNYSQVRMYCSVDIPEYGLEANEWSEMSDASNRVILNYGDENDVVIYNANGTRDVYQQSSEITEGTNDSGDTYQEMEITDGDGAKITIMLFDDFMSMIHYYEDGSYLIIQYYE
ncbi:MAG: hypothetical protein IPM74_04865 [Crocinitomicaceae bacterium]|nr:hypothetical protein [Crocinitomicaceae bacterium]MBK8925237.1 hypothetical protein [Crocinitomicaceae bacterium]